MGDHRPLLFLLVLACACGMATGQQFNVNLVRNPTCEETVPSSGQIPQWVRNDESKVWICGVNQFSPKPPTGVPAYFHGPSQGGDTYVYQDIPLSLFVADINAGVLFELHDMMATYDFNRDRAVWEIEWRNIQTVLQTDTSGEHTFYSRRWYGQIVTLQPPPGTNAVRVKLKGKWTGYGWTDAFHADVDLRAVIQDGSLCDSSMRATLPSQLGSSATAFASLQVPANAQRLWVRVLGNDLPVWLSTNASFVNVTVYGARLKFGSCASLPPLPNPAMLGKGSEYFVLLLPVDGATVLPQAIELRAQLPAAVKGASDVNLLVNPGFEDFVEFSMRVPGWDQPLSASASRFMTLDNAAKTGSRSVMSYSAVPDVLTQTVDVRGWNETIDAGLQAVTMSMVISAWPMSRMDVVAVGDDGQALRTVSSLAKVISNSNQWQSFQETSMLPVGTRFVRVELHHSGVDMATTTKGSWFDDVSLTLPATTTGQYCSPPVRMQVGSTYDLDLNTGLVPSNPAFGVCFANPGKTLYATVLGTGDTLMVNVSLVNAGSASSVRASWVQFGQGANCMTSLDIRCKRGAMVPDLLRIDSVRGQLHMVVISLPAGETPSGPVHLQVRVTPVFEPVYATNLMANPDATETVAVTGFVPGWQTTCEGYAYDTSGAPPNTAYFHPERNLMLCTLFQTIDLTPYAEDVDAGQMWFRARDMATSGDAKDQPSVQVMSHSANMTVLNTVSSGLLGKATNVWTVYDVMVKPPAGARWLTLGLSAKFVEGSYNNAYHTHAQLVAQTPYRNLSTVDLSIIKSTGQLLTNAQPGAMQPGTGLIDDWDSMDGYPVHWWLEGTAPEVYFKSDGPNPVLFQDIDVRFFAVGMDTGAMPWWCRVHAWVQQTSDHDLPGIGVDFLDQAKTTVLAAREYWEPSSNDYTWKQREMYFQAPAGTRWMRFKLMCKRAYGTNCDGYIRNVTAVATVIPPPTPTPTPGPTPAFQCGSATSCTECAAQRNCMFCNDGGDSRCVGIGDKTCGGYVQTTSCSYTPPVEGRNCSASRPVVVGGTYQYDLWTWTHGVPTSLQSQSCVNAADGQDDFGVWTQVVGEGKWVSLSCFYGSSSTECKVLLLDGTCGIGGSSDNVSCHDVTSMVGGTGKCGSYFNQVPFAQWKAVANRTYTLRIRCNSDSYDTPARFSFNGVCGNPVLGEKYDSSTYPDCNACSVGFFGSRCVSKCTCTRKYGYDVCMALQGGPAGAACNYTSLCSPKLDGGGCSCPSCVKDQGTCDMSRGVCVCKRGYVGVQCQMKASDMMTTAAAVTFTLMGCLMAATVAMVWKISSSLRLHEATADQVRLNGANLLAMGILVYKSGQFTALSFTQAVPWHSSVGGVKDAFRGFFLFEFNGIGWELVFNVTWIFAGLFLVSLVAYLRSNGVSYSSMPRWQQLLVAPFPYLVQLASGLSMTMMRTLFQGIACNYDVNDTLPYMWRLPEVACWVPGKHGGFVAGCVMGVLMLYPAMTRLNPYLDRFTLKKDLRFEPRYLIVVLQVEVILAMVSSVTHAKPTLFLVAPLMLILVLFTLGTKPCKFHWATQTRSIGYMFPFWASLCALMAFYLGPGSLYPVITLFLGFGIMLALMVGVAAGFVKPPAYSFERLEKALQGDTWDGKGGATTKELGDSVEYREYHDFASI